MNTRERKHLQRAIDISKTSTSRQKHGAVVTDGAKVMTVAVNTDRNHPNICTNPKMEASYHAEINALKQLRGIDVSGMTLYSARTNNHGDSMNAKPCKNCQLMLDILGIRKVIHT